MREDNLKIPDYTLLRLYLPFDSPVDQEGGFLSWVTRAACLVACLGPQCSFGGTPWLPAWVRLSLSWGQV